LWIGGMVFLPDDAVTGRLTPTPTLTPLRAGPGASVNDSRRSLIVAVLRAEASYRQCWMGPAAVGGRGVGCSRALCGCRSRAVSFAASTPMEAADCRRVRAHPPPGGEGGPSISSMPRAIRQRSRVVSYPLTPSPSCGLGEQTCTGPSASMPLIPADCSLQVALLLRFLAIRRRFCRDGPRRGSREADDWRDVTSPGSTMAAVALGLAASRSPPKSRPSGGGADC